MTRAACLVDEVDERTADDLQVELVGWTAAEPGDVRRAVELALRGAGLLKAAETDERVSG